MKNAGKENFELAMLLLEKVIRALSLKSSRMMIIIS